MKRYGLAALVGVVCLSAAGTGQAPRRGPRADDWRDLAADRIAGFGHRNWVVVADAAYPAQVAPGIETVVTHADQIDVVKAVLDELGKVKHVRPVVYTDAELPFVSERDAPGIADYRRDLKGALSDLKPQSVPHEQLIDRLNKAGERFRVLVLKTDLMLPYSSVFVELEAGYWSAEAEIRLRDAIRQAEKK
jgi:hypothetical protein